MTARWRPPWPRRRALGAASRRRRQNRLPAGLPAGAGSRTSRASRRRPLPKGGGAQLPWPRRTRPPRLRPPGAAGGRRRRGRLGRWRSRARPVRLRTSRLRSPLHRRTRAATPDVGPSGDASPRRPRPQTPSWRPRPMTQRPRPNAAAPRRRNRPSPNLRTDAQRARPALASTAHRRPMTTTLPRSRPRSRLWSWPQPTAPRKAAPPLPASGAEPPKTRRPRQTRRQRSRQHHWTRRPTARGGPRAPPLR